MHLTRTDPKANVYRVLQDGNRAGSFWRLGPGARMRADQPMGAGAH